MIAAGFVAADRCAFSRIVRVTQRHIVDRRHREASRAAGSFRAGLAARRVRMLADVAIQRMDNVGIVVGDLDAAVAFFAACSLSTTSMTPSPACAPTAPNSSAR